MRSFGVLLLAGTVAQLAAAAPVPAELDKLLALVMAGRPSEQTIAAQADEALETIRQYPREADRARLEASLEFLVGFGRLGLEATAAAQANFERAARLAERANRLEQTSEGYRVLADSLSQLLELRGTAYRVVNAGRARSAAERAVELNASNPFAHIAAASYYASAPSFAGGSPARAAGHLETAARLSDDPYVVFFVAAWEAQLADASGDRPAAAEAIGRASRIFPDNWWLEAVASRMGVDLPE